VLTDNGSEFTDRFAVDKKAKPHDKPSGAHAFDRICTERRITHRLIRPFRPQTNGMVERFNRRLGEHLDRRPQLRAHRRFRDHAERDTYLYTFVTDYNRTRLRCLGYQAPAELLANLAGHNTFAGAGSSSTAIRAVADAARPAPTKAWSSSPSRKCRHQRTKGQARARGAAPARLHYRQPMQPRRRPQRPRLSLVPVQKHRFSARYGSRSRFVKVNNSRRFAVA
jgi:hypothetical protein